MAFVLGYVGAPDATSPLLALLALLAVLAARRYLGRVLGWAYLRLVEREW